MKRNTWLESIVVSMVAVLSTSARADLIYAGGSLTDTATGLVWTRGQLPTSTFIPTTGATVATYEQFVSLITSLGIDPSPSNLHAMPYSPAIAALTDWYGDWAYLYGGPEPEAVCNGPNGGGNCFVGTGLVHQYDGNGLWTAYIVQTISRYGPTFTNPPGGWQQEFVPTLFVVPVPLPASAWLALSAFAVLTRIRRTTRAS